MKRKSARIKQHQNRVSTLRAKHGDNCWLCGAPMSFERRMNDPLGASLDHVIELSAGGSNQLSNLRLAHQRCNSMRRRHFAHTIVPAKLKGTTS